MPNANRAPPSRVAVVFDLDGTLVDSHRDIANAVNVALGALGRPPVDVEAVKTMVGHGVHHLLRCALGTDDEGLVQTGRDHFARAYQAGVLEHTRLYPGLDIALSELDRRGFELSIATNKPSRFTRPILEGLGLDRRPMRGAASADEAPAPKPDPAVVRLALERAGSTGLPVIYVGDMPVDVQTARAFGCPVVGVGWGFDPAALVAAAPDRLIRAPADLPAAVEAVRVGPFDPVSP